MFTIQSSVEIVASFDEGTTEEYPSLVHVEVLGRNLSEELVLLVARQALAMELGTDLDDLESRLDTVEALMGSEGSKVVINLFP